MSLKIDHKTAKALLLKVANEEKQRKSVPGEWVGLFEEISEECERSKARTHIAFIATALLAKSVDSRVDTYARKVSAGTPGAYDARSLAHKVLVPVAQELDIHLGVTGREPLNNQPYFRINRASKEELLPIVRSKSTAKRVLHILDKIHVLDPASAQMALGAFIRVRRRYSPDYPSALNHVLGSEVSVLIKGAKAICSLGSGGRNAQAVVAGILHAGFFEEHQVECGRINDPDRNFVGDVCLCKRSITGQNQVPFVAYEVREKNVNTADLISFMRKCAQNDVSRAAMVAVKQSTLLIEADIPYKWGEERGITLMVYQSWDDFVRDVIFWALERPGAVVEKAYQLVREYLIELEAGQGAVEAWDNIFVLQQVEPGTPICHSPCMRTASASLTRRLSKWLMVCYSRFKVYSFHANLNSTP